MLIVKFDQKIKDLTKSQSFNPFMTLNYLNIISPNITGTNPYILQFPQIVSLHRFNMPVQLASKT